MDTHEQDPGAGHALMQVFDDLEQQAAGLHLLERDLEVDDVSSAEYAGVDLESRLRASLGREVAVHLRGSWQVQGRLVRAGAGWAVLRGAGETTWLLATACVTSLGGLDPRAAHPATRSIADALPLRAVLRRLGEEAVGGSQLHLVDGRRLEGRTGRVGSDFVELRGTPDRVVPLGGLAAVRWSAW